MEFKKTLAMILENPHTYFAFVTAGLSGLIIGTLIGAVAGAYLASNQIIFADLYGIIVIIQSRIIIGGLMGAIIGALCCEFVLMSYFIMRANILKLDTAIYNKEGVVFSLTEWSLLAIELAAAMAIGATLGSLSQPGTGTILGTIFATLVVLSKMIYEDYLFYHGGRDR